MQFYAAFFAMISIVNAMPGCKGSSCKPLPPWGWGCLGFSCKFYCEKSGGVWDLNKNTCDCSKKTDFECINTKVCINGKICVIDTSIKMHCHNRKLVPC